MRQISVLATGVMNEKENSFSEEKRPHEDLCCVEGTAQATRLALIFIFERSTGVYFRVFLGYFIVLPQRTQEHIDN